MKKCKTISDIAYEQCNTCKYCKKTFLFNIGQQELYCKLYPVQISNSSYQYCAFANWDGNCIKYSPSILTKFITILNKLNIYNK